jgi:hypothetical protein
MRWTAKRKEEIVVSLEKGLMTTAEARRQFRLSDDELAAWRQDYAAYGWPGLLVTALRQPRKRKAGVDR